MYILARYTYRPASLFTPPVSRSPWRAYSGASLLGLCGSLATMLLC